MVSSNARGEETDDIIRRIREQVGREAVRFTAHAHAEMVEEEITLGEVFESLGSGRVLENYPDHRRGACCLVSGNCASGRALHVVCTTGEQLLIVITVYELKPPKWLTPKERRARS